jgi:hypothetical protein
MKNTICTYNDEMRNGMRICRNVDMCDVRDVRRLYSIYHICI